MLKVTHWCLERRKTVVLVWLAVAVGLTVLAQAAGRNYATNFTLPGTESQQALNLLKREFPAQGGDTDTIVFHTSGGSVFSPRVRGAVVPLLARVAGMPHVALVVSPYNSVRGRLQVSPDRRTAFSSGVPVDCAS